MDDVWGDDGDRGFFGRMFGTDAGRLLDEAHANAWYPRLRAAEDLDAEDGGPDTALREQRS